MDQPLPEGIQHDTSINKYNGIEGDGGIPACIMRGFIYNPAFVKEALNKSHTGVQKRYG
jgi:hypothetical protein